MNLSETGTVVGQPHPSFCLPSGDSWGEGVHNSRLTKPADMRRRLLSSLRDCLQCGKMMPPSFNSALSSPPRAPNTTVLPHIHIRTSFTRTYYHIFASSSPIVLPDYFILCSSSQDSPAQTPFPPTTLSANNPQTYHETLKLDTRTAMQQQ
ncbi:hypothetical protein BJV77DRAFT_403501 [Russula vinacea]|nr:hypothetical protein BJV77DRAFT_403501 [Russula vinacea]